MSDRTVLVVGGTSGIGLEIARRAIGRGDSVIVTGRDQARADEVAKSLGNGARGLALDLAVPSALASALADVESVDSLILAAVERDANTVKDYDIDRAIRLVTLKLVGYTEVV